MGSPIITTLSHGYVHTMSIAPPCDIVALTNYAPPGRRLRDGRSIQVAGDTDPSIAIYDQTLRNRFALPRNTSQTMLKSQVAVAQLAIFAILGTSAFATAMATAIA